MWCLGAGGKVGVRKELYMMQLRKKVYLRVAPKSLTQIFVLFIIKKITLHAKILVMYWVKLSLYTKTYEWREQGCQRFQQFYEILYLLVYLFFVTGYWHTGSVNF